MATHHRNGREETVIVLGPGVSGQGKSLVRTIDYALKELIGEVDDDMQEVFDEVGEEAARRLQEISSTMFGGKGNYAKGWKYERQKTVRGKKLSLVRNKNQPQLTHLLEYGHPIFSHGKKTKGYAKAHPHIETVNEWVQAELPRKLEQILKK